MSQSMPQSMPQSSSPSTTSLPALMSELTMALAELSEKMGMLAFVLERQHLDRAPEAAASRQAARDVIQRARSAQ